MDPLTLAAISAIPSAIQGVVGLTQSAKSKNILKDLQRPTYNIPTEATAALNAAKNLASSNQMAGQTNVEQRLDQASANAMYGIEQNATSGAEALAALTGVYSNQMGQENALGLNAAQDYQRRQQAAQSAMNTYAGWQDKAWDYNTNQPYQDKLSAAQALGEAGMRNKYEGLKGVVGVGANYLKGMTPKTENVGSLASDALSENVGMGGNEVSAETTRALENAVGMGGNQGVLSNDMATGINNALGSVAGKSYDSYGNEMAIQKSVITPKVSPQMTAEQLAQYKDLKGITPEQLALIAKMLGQQ